MIRYLGERNAFIEKNCSSRNNSTWKWNQHRDCELNTWNFGQKAFIKTSVSILSHNDTIHRIDFERIFRKRVNSLLFSHPPSFHCIFLLFFFLFFLFCFVLFFFLFLFLPFDTISVNWATSILKISTRTNVKSLSFETCTVKKTL